MNEPDANEVIADGLAAWRRGDIDRLGQILDPAATLRAIEPGPWDCENRDQVMSFLRARASQRGERGFADVEVLPLDESTYLVSGLGGPKETATIVTVSAGRVMSMQQISTAAPDPNAQAAVTAVRAGDVAVLQAILVANPELAPAALMGYGGRTLLHVATDWPGYWPNGPEIVRVLVESGADPNHRGGDNTEGETPLHWAASSDDVDVAAALLDGGADPEAPDGSIGTPLDNAIGYGCWHVARLLETRGARIEKLWHAAALGRLDLIESQLASASSDEEISQAFWHACAASQRRAAERLLLAGADLNWTPDYAEGTALDAAKGTSTRQNNVIEWLQTHGVASTHSTP